MKSRAARRAGIEDLDKVYTRDEMVTGDVIFAATGVTDGSIVQGIRTEPGWVTTENAADALQDRIATADDLSLAAVNAAQGALPPPGPFRAGLPRSILRQDEDGVRFGLDRLSGRVRRPGLGGAQQPRRRGKGRAAFDGVARALARPVVHVRHPEQDAGQAR